MTGTAVLLNAYLGWLGAALTMTLLKGKYGLASMGFFGAGPLAWTVGAARLAKPDSVWARAFYDNALLALASARFPHSPGRDLVAPPASPRPIEVDRAFRLLLASGVLMLPLGVFGGPIAGAFLVTAFLVRAGWQRALPAVSVLAAAHLALVTALVFTLDLPPVVVLGDAAAAIPFVGALVSLSTPPARAYVSRRTPRPRHRARGRRP